jgi:hypothetical protein
MKVEVLTPFLHDGIRYDLGDTRTVTDELGEYFCRAGWVNDLSGQVVTASPGVSDVVLMVDNVSSNQPVKTV